MLEKIAQKLHFFILLYSAFTIYTMWDESQIQLNSLENQKPVIEKRIAKTRKEIKQLKKYNEDVEQARERIELVAQEVERTQKQLPAEISDIDNINLLRGAAEGMNIKNVSVTPLEEEMRAFYFAKKYELKGKGTFLQFMIFLEKIAQNERLLNINEIKLERSPEDQRGRFQVINAEIIVEAYRYNPDYTENRGIE